MYAPTHPTTQYRPTFTLASTAVAAAIPAVLLAVVAFPVPALGFLAGVATALVARR